MLIKNGLLLRSWVGLEQATRQYNNWYNAQGDKNYDQKNIGE